MTTRQSSGYVQPISLNVSRHLHDHNRQSRQISVHVTGLAGIHLQANNPAMVLDLSTALCTRQAMVTPLGPLTPTPYPTPPPPSPHPAPPPHTPPPPDHHHLGLQLPAVLHSCLMYSLQFCNELSSPALFIASDPRPAVDRVADACRIYCCPSFPPNSSPLDPEPAE